MALSSPALLFTVASAHQVPGLGLLVLPGLNEQSPHIPYALHTALPVRLLLPDGTAADATATVEEVSQNGRNTAALLLQLERPLVVPANTRILLLAEPNDALFGDEF